MQKVRKICCRITPRRILGSILVAASLVNMIIVGVVFEVSLPAAIPPINTIGSSAAATKTFFVPTATAAESTPTTLVPSSESTQTASSTATETSTATNTATNLPSSTACAQRYDWPIYIVRRGDTLSALASATGSSVEELRLANCLPNTRIYEGQRLYVPRLPVASPTNPPTAPTNTPTVFRDPSACIVRGTNEIVFSITPYDPEGIRLLTASYQIQSSPTQNQTNLEADGDTYYGSGPASDQYSLGSISYSFVATDNLGSITESIAYSTSLQLC